ncbi:MAG: hypothetical protein WBI17_10530 [Clostridiaceae bacterium]
MKRTKLVYTNRDEDIQAKVEETLIKYHIQKEDLIDIRYHEKDSRKNALIIYNSK